MSAKSRLYCWLRGYSTKQDKRIKPKSLLWPARPSDLRRAPASSLHSLSQLCFFTYFWMFLKSTVLPLLRGLCTSSSLAWKALPLEINTAHSFTFRRTLFHCHIHTQTPRPEYDVAEVCGRSTWDLRSCLITLTCFIVLRCVSAVWLSIL